MSVGLQRLREEPDAIRKGAIDKGEDPALVDAALAADARRLPELLAGIPSKVNLIPWNPVAEIAARENLHRPAAHRVDAFADSLRRGGLNVTVRRQRGTDSRSRTSPLFTLG